MKAIHLKISSTVFFVLIIAGNISAAFQKENDLYPLLFLQNSLTAVVVNDNFSPPVAARDYVYPHLAAYYILSLNDPGKKVFEAITHFPKIVVNTKNKYSSSLAASFAFYEVARKLIYTEKQWIDSFHVLINWYKKNGLPPALMEASRKLGESVAEQIILWMGKDRFIETRMENKYVLLNAPGKWQLTPPGYFPAVEPHWGEIRPMVVSKVDDRGMVPKIFDTSTRSDFYSQAAKVFAIRTSLTDEQKAIAAFWDCNPFALQSSGHAQHFVKKMSPGAHWIHISLVACRQKKLGMKEASRVTALTSLVIFDAFIQTWKLKFEFSTVRPETFIQQSGMDEGWQPFIQTPPFPEFPSGHAAVSAASAAVLTDIFGKDFAYTDNTELSFGLPERSFHSFKQAAREASVSRVYGGIHFPYSCTLGEKLGEEIAAGLLAKPH